MVAMAELDNAGNAKPQPVYNPRIVSPPASYKSKVWQYIGFEERLVNGVNKIDRSRAMCRLCKTTVACSTGNTTNMANHLSRKHADVYKTSSTANGNATQSSASSGKRSHSQSQSSTSPIGQLRLHDVLASKFHPTSSRAIAITKAIGIFISKDMRPYSVVNNAGFKALVQVLEPRYTVPSRTHFADSVIPKL